MSEKAWSVSTRDISIDSRCLYKFYLFSTCQMILPILHVPNDSV